MSERIVRLSEEAYKAVVARFKSRIERLENETRTQVYILSQQKTITDDLESRLASLRAEFAAFESDRVPAIPDFLFGPTF